MTHSLRRICSLILHMKDSESQTVKAVVIKTLQLSLAHSLVNLNPLFPAMLLFAVQNSKLKFLVLCFFPLLVCFSSNQCLAAR